MYIYLQASYIHLVLECAYLNEFFNNSVEANFYCLFGLLIRFWNLVGSKGVWERVKKGT